MANQRTQPLPILKAPMPFIALTGQEDGFLVPPRGACETHLALRRLLGTQRAYRRSAHTLAR